jgi:hypothetical protein
VALATSVSITRLRNYVCQRAPTLTTGDEVRSLIAYAVLRITNLMQFAWRLSKVRMHKASEPTWLPALDLGLLRAERGPAADDWVSVS